MHIDWRGTVWPHPAEAVHIGRPERRYLRHKLHKTSDVTAEQRTVLAIGVGEQVSAGFGINHRLVNMHCAARLPRHRVRHEGRIDAVLLGDRANGALKKKHLIRQLQRVAMDKVHLKLGRAHFMDHRIDIEAHQLTVIIDVVDDIFIFVHRLQPIRLACCFRTPA